MQLPEFWKLAEWIPCKYVENIKSGRTISFPRQSHSSEQRQQLQTFGEKEASASELSEVSGFSITKNCVFLLHVLQVAEVYFHLKGHSSGKIWPFTSLFFPHGKKITHLAVLLMICPDDLIKSRTRSTAFKLATKERLIKKKLKHSKEPQWAV